MVHVFISAMQPNTAKKIEQKFFWGKFRDERKKKCKNICDILHSTRAPPISILTIAGRAAANPPPSILININMHIYYVISLELVVEPHQQWSFSP